jgi:hypothetical protein
MLLLDAENEEIFDIHDSVFIFIFYDFLIASE